MEQRMPTRRCVRSKVPCQEIQNIFNMPHQPLLNLIPDHIWKFLPSTQKISCEIIQGMKQLIPPHSNQYTLKQLKDNARLQYQEIVKMTGDTIQPNNVQPPKEDNLLEEKGEQIKIYWPPLTKLIKKENCTKDVSDCEEQREECIFADQEVMQRLEDYLSID